MTTMRPFLSTASVLNTGSSESMNAQKIAQKIAQKNVQRNAQPNEQNAIAQQSVQQNNEHIANESIRIEESLLAGVASNVVQSIRAFRIAELQQEAAKNEQHFLYAYCAEASTKQQVLSKIAASFGFPKHFGKNLDALSDCLTDLVHKAGKQAGFIVVIEQLPNTLQFDKEARESLLDVFRDAADFWAKKNVAFRVFYSFE